MHLNDAGERGWEVIVGGGQGRTPIVGITVRDFLPEAQLLPYLEAIMRVYNLHGRRDNKYKARIKILVHELGAEEFKRRGRGRIRQEELQRRGSRTASSSASPAYFAPPPFETLSKWSPEFEEARITDRDFANWVQGQCGGPCDDGYAIVNISLKPEGGIPGDATADQMRAVADLAERFSFDELRVSHHQNLVLPHVKRERSVAIWKILRAHDLASANLGLVGDIIACPGLDYCALATARSIPIAQSISRRFADLSTGSRRSAR